MEREPLLLLFHEPLLPEPKDEPPKDEPPGREPLMLGPRSPKLPEVEPPGR